MKNFIKKCIHSPNKVKEPKKYTRKKKLFKPKFTPNYKPNYKKTKMHIKDLLKTGCGGIFPVTAKL